VSTVCRRTDVVFTTTGRPVPALATLVHQEHDPIALPPGTYRVWRQREHPLQAPVGVTGRPWVPEGSSG